MNLFLRSVYLSSAMALVYIVLLYLSHPHRRVRSAPMLISFGLGMLAVIPVILIERLIPGFAATETWSSVVAAPLVEEGVKLCIFLLTIWRLGYPTLIEPIDYAILFAVLGVGFGVYEDFWYVFHRSYPSWISGEIGRFNEVFRWMAYARSFPGHLMFNALAGFLLGWASRAKDTRTRGRWILAAFATAVLAHSLFNATASLSGTIPLWTLMVAYLGIFLALRRQSLSQSPFRSLERLVEGGTDPWQHQQTPVEILFAEGYGWPGRPKRGFLQFFPLTLSLIILFPVLVSGMYFVHRLLVSVLPSG